MGERWFVVWLAQRERRVCMLRAFLEASGNVSGNKWSKASLIAREVDTQSTLKQHHGISSCFSSCKQSQRW